MPDRKREQESRFQCVGMDALVPENHILRRLNQGADLSAVYEHIRMGKLVAAGFGDH